MPTTSQNHLSERVCNVHLRDQVENDKPLPANNLEWEPAHELYRVGLIIRSTVMP